MDGNGIGNGQYVRYIAADDGLSAVPGRPSLGAGPTDARRWIPPPPRARGSHSFTRMYADSPCRHLGAASDHGDHSHTSLRRTQSLQ